MMEGEEMKGKFRYWMGTSMLVTILTIGLTITSMGAENEKNMKVQLKSQVEAIGIEKEITLNEPEVYRTKGTTFVAAAQVFKVLGRQIEWRQDTKKLIVDNGRISFTVGSKKIETSRGDLEMSQAALTKEGRIYIPLNSFSEIFGYNVRYNEGIIQIYGSEHIGKAGSYEESLSEKRITISAAGDFTLGYYKGQASGGRFDEVASKNGYSYFMNGVRAVFEEDDLTIVNLEGPFTTRGVATEKEFAIRGLPEYAQILKLGSIEAVNLANNHIYDYQKVGYDDTVSVLKKNGIGYFGEENTYFTTVNDIRIALIGANGWSNSGAVKEKLKQRITAAKMSADLIIVEFHWGVERDYYPNNVQKDLAKYVIDQGANLVLGSHPHVIQGIGTYKDANIVYSMGNFCFGANKNPSDKDTFIYRETFILTEDGITSEEVEVIPCSISSTKSKNDYQPTVLTGSEKERVLKRLETYSKGLNN